jgi:hypothetical protein
MVRGLGYSPFLRTSKAPTRLTKGYFPADGWRSDRFLNGRGRPFATSLGNNGADFGACRRAFDQPASWRAPYSTGRQRSQIWFIQTILIRPKQFKLSK